MVPVSLSSIRVRVGSLRYHGMVAELAVRIKARGEDSYASALGI
jgi:hypothetical protein